MIPAAPVSASLSCSSRSEQSMPKDSIPRNLTGLIVTPPGNLAPTSATAVLRPTLAFGAPQMICRGSSAALILTLQTRKRSALGCCTDSRISPTTI